MSKQLIQIDVNLTSAQANQYLSRTSTDTMEFMSGLINLLEAGRGGLMDMAVNAKLNATYATITGTFTGVPSNTQTITIGGQAITAVTSGATANQFNIGADAAANAVACAAAINASSTLSQWVVASASGDVLTVRALTPGTMGNAITLAETFSNFTWAGSATRLAGGSQSANVTYSEGYVAETA